MRRWNSQKRRAQRGFTLTELMIVVAVALVIAAVAVPNVLRGMRQLRLRSTASSAVGILQQARQRAVRDNRNYQVLLGAIPGSAIPMLFIDLNADGNYQRPEPLVQLPADIALPAASPWNNNQLEQVMAPGAPLGTELLIISASRATAPTFNARGRACQPGNLPNGVTPDGITVCNTEVGGGGAQRVAYGIYLQSPILGDQGWAAVTVSPGGRIKRWSRDVAAGTWR